MFVPNRYRPPSPQWCLQLMKRNPLATLVTNGHGQPYVTHCPVIPSHQIDAEDPPATDADLVSGELVGHLHKMNPHAAALAAGARCVVVFQGPHGYVSPVLYHTTPAPPTWNFTSVHVTGSLQPVADREETLAIVRATAAVLEAGFGQGWDARPSLGYFRQILSGVQAFRVRVELVEGMAKLSQEQPVSVRGRVAEHFAAHQRDLHRELSELIRDVDVYRPAATSRFA